MARLFAGLVAAALVAGCAGGPTAEPAESALTAPIAPTGWAMVVAFGGNGGQGSAATNVQLGGKRTTLHVLCAGLGTVVVQLGEEHVAPAVVFPCGGHGGVADNRYEIANISIPQQMTVMASVIEGPSDLFHSTFYVSIEQPTV